MAIRPSARPITLVRNRSTPRQRGKRRKIQRVHGTCVSLCVIGNCRQNRKTQVSPELLSGNRIQKCPPRHRVRAVLSERNAIFTRLTCGRPVVSTALQKGVLVRYPHWVYGKTDSRHRKDPRTAELCKCLPANNSRYHHSSYRRRPGNSRRRRGRCNRAP